MGGGQSESNESRGGGMTRMVSVFSKSEISTAAGR